jgi:hypothetical protein
MKSTRFTLQLRDFFKGAIMAIGTPVVSFVLDSLQAQQFTFNAGKLGIVAAAAFATYLLKNYLTDDVKAAEKVLETAKQQ